MALPVQSIAYATPGIYLPPAGVVSRLGSILIVPRDAALPPRCVKCNAAADPKRTWTKTFYWHHPAVYLLILAGVLLYAIVALIIRKRAKAQVGLCTQHADKYRLRVIVGWAIVLLGGCLVAAYYVGNSPTYRRMPDAPSLVIAGFVLLLLAGLWHLGATRVIYPKMISDGAAHYAGAGEPFLDSLPAAGAV